MRESVEETENRLNLARGMIAIIGVLALILTLLE
jgi:hypothetical protein